MLADIAAAVRPLRGRGRVASYIPSLRRVPPDRFALAVAGVDGVEAAVGDCDEPFSLQSITKVPALILALNLAGDAIWARVGKEPSGTPFNFLAQLEAERGVPRNPFVNAGALAVTDFLLARLPDPAGALRDLLALSAGGGRVTVDEAVAASELAHAHKGRAIVSLLRLHRTIRCKPEAVLAAYCRQCALTMPARDLARAFLPLAARGHSPSAGETVTTEGTARRVRALMLTCGMYDSVGSFAYRVGLPAKSGVGGGIVAVVPDVGVVAVWSPELDRSGNSLMGTMALEHFVRFTGLSVT